MNSSTIERPNAQTLNREFTGRSQTAIIFETLVLVFINLLALFGNTLVVIAFLWKPRLRNSTNTLIIALCMSDIMMALFPMPLSVGALILGEWPFTGIPCTFQGFMVNFLAFVSLQIMALTAINRYYKIKKPVKCNAVFKIRNTILMISAACLISLAVSVSIVFTANDFLFAFHPGKTICVAITLGVMGSFIYTAVSSLFFVVLPAAIIVFCYARVFTKLRHHNQRLNCRIGEIYEISREAKSMRRESQLSRMEMVISRTLFGIVLGFFVCWIPCFGIDVADVIIREALNRRVYLVYMYLAYTSSAINPVIYGVLNPSFRREFLNVLSCRKRVEIRP